jgi:hypothetical protein
VSLDGRFATSGQEAETDPKETYDFLQSGHRAITLSALAGTAVHRRM